MAWSGCTNGANELTYHLWVTDDHDTPSQLTVKFSWQGQNIRGFNIVSSDGTSAFNANLGPFTWNGGGGPADTLTITITATDSSGLTTTLTPRPVNMAQCIIIG
jgi:hypothetical protein